MSQSEAPKDYYIIIIGKSSDDSKPSHTAYLVYQTQLEAARIFAMLYTRYLGWSVENLLWDIFSDSWVDPAADGYRREPTQEEIDKNIQELTVEFLSDNVYLGYEKFEIEKWKNYDIPLLPLKEVPKYVYS